MGKRNAKPAGVAATELRELLDRLERALPDLTGHRASHPDVGDLTRRLGRIRAGLSERPMHRSPAGHPRQPAAASLPLFF
jgi:hypothetical protein